MYYWKSDSSVCSLLHLIWNTACFVGLLISCKLRRLITLHCCFVQLAGSTSEPGLAVFLKQQQNTQYCTIYICAQYQSLVSSPNELPGWTRYGARAKVECQRVQMHTFHPSTCNRTTVLSPPEQSEATCKAYSMV